MLTLRRRLGSWALAVLFCQSVAVFAAPLSSCCASAHAAATAAGDDEDCCPAGSHAPGRCPRHAAAAKTRSCRVQCDAPHGVQFLIAALGVLPAPVASTFVLTAGTVVSNAQPATVVRASVPHAPPPRLA